jgi:hypothetical protein
VVDDLKKVIGLSGIPSLIKLLKGTPNNDTLHLIVVRAFKSLAEDGNLSSFHVLCLFLIITLNNSITNLCFEMIILRVNDASTD